MTLMWTKIFSKLNKNDAAIAGGKGSSLGEMTQVGIPVPPGYVVLSNAFNKFIEASDINIEIDAILKTVDINAMHTVEKASADIQRLILEEKEIPREIEKEVVKSFKSLNAEFVAVRSSATSEDSVGAAWAGQLDTFLNTTEETLLQNIRKCWASLFTPRAIFYRFEKQLDQTHISVAVVVQKMVNSESAGIAFSVHPVTEDQNQIIIEAGFGLGEAVVSGQITPDSYVVTKEPREVLDKNIIEQKIGLFRKEGGGNDWKDIPNGVEQVLSDNEILTLSEIIITIENHYGFPCDVEWAKEGDGLYIIQSRPITTLSASEDSTLQQLKKQTFECTVRFPKIPVLYLEAMNEGLRDNPYFDLADQLPNPTSVTLIDNELQGWMGTKDRVSVSNEESIRKIEKASLECIPQNQKKFELVLNADEADLADPLKLIKLIETSNSASANTYKHFMYFIDESFKTSNQELIEQLQKTRLELDTLVTKYLFPAFERLVGALVAQHNFPQTVVEYLTTSEIIKCLESPRTLKEYPTGNFREIAFVLSDGRIQTFFNEKAEKIKKYLERQDPDRKLVEEVSDKNVIKGSVGNKGTARGRVRKLLGQELYDKDKLESLSKDKDFVFVVSMTAPEAVPYFKHARAFVTDEGGITCHAAIIARELGKPCVIGTKIATQVLKNGDEVEVDANEGTVRILKED